MTQSSVSFPTVYPSGVAARMEQDCRIALQSADAVVVCSQATESAARHYFGMKIPAIVTLAAPRACFRPIPRTSTQAQDTPYFLFVGRIDSRKNVRSLVQAYRELIKEGLACRLIIVGPPDSGSGQLGEILAEQPVAQEDIVVTGYLPEADLVKLYQGALAFVLPTLNEGFGMPVLEALACGTPAITSDIPVMREMLGDWPLLVNPLEIRDLREAMRRLLVDPEVRPILARQGLDLSSGYSWNKSAQRLLQGMSALS